MFEIRVGVANEDGYIASERIPEHCPSVDLLQATWVSKQRVEHHHVMDQSSAARRRRQGPKAARERGRSEAKSLARRRAQRQHRCVMANRRADLSTGDQLARPAQNQIFPETFPHDLRAHQTCGGALSSGRPRLADSDEDRWQSWRERPRQGSDRAAFGHGWRGRSRYGPCSDSDSMGGKERRPTPPVRATRCRTSWPAISWA
jgi:hypothetical protein